MRRNPLPLFALGIALSLALAACGEQDDAVLEQPPIDDLIGEEEPDGEPPADDDPIGEDEPDGEPPADDDPAGEDSEEDAADDGSTGGDDAAGGSDSREITIATADAAERAGVAEGDVTLVSFELVTWPDGSLGCPEPDVMYTQALVEGYRIVLEAGGERYTYHGALGEDPFYCADPGEPLGPSS